MCTVGSRSCRGREHAGWWLLTQNEERQVPSEAALTTSDTVHGGTVDGSEGIMQFAKGAHGMGEETRAAAVYETGCAISWREANKTNELVGVGPCTG